MRQVEWMKRRKCMQSFPRASIELGDKPMRRPVFLGHCRLAQERGFRRGAVTAQPAFSVTYLSPDQIRMLDFDPLEMLQILYLQGLMKWSQRRDSNS